MHDEILTIDNLSTKFFTENGTVRAVNDLSLRVGRGDVFGIVGESGSGKSVTARSVMDLVDSGNSSKSTAPSSTAFG